MKNEMKRLKNFGVVWLLKKKLMSGAERLVVPFEIAVFERIKLS